MKRLLKKLLRIVLSIVLFFVALMLIAFSYFFIKKNQIAEVLLLSLNQQINGEVSFKDIYLQPFIQFPSVSLALKEFAFFENPDSVRTILEDPIAEFEQVYIAFDVIDLMHDKFTITKVLFEDGFLDVIKYQDKKFNFQIALGAKKAGETKKGPLVKIVKREGIKTKKKEVKRKPLISKTLKLKLNKITLKDVYLEYNNQLNGKQANFFFEDMIASLSIMPDSIYTSLYTKAEVKKLEISNVLKFNDLDIQLQTVLKINRNDSTVKVEPSKLILARAEFRLNGLLDLKDEGLVDFNIGGFDKKLGFLSLLLTESGIENLETGNLFLEGSLKGTLMDEIPELFIDFGVKDLSLKIPGTADSIKHLNLFGNFRSGNKEDLSLAGLKIDTFKAQLPDGFIDGALEMKNLIEPRVKYSLDLKVNVMGLENAFRLYFIDSLKGTIDLQDEFEGVFHPGKGWVDRKKGNLMLHFDSLSFRIPEVMDVNYLSGSITEKNNKILLKKIKILTGNSDLLIDGDIRNLSNLIFDEGKNIVANLSILSDLYDLPEFLTFIPSIGESFPYQLSNIRLKFRAISSRTELMEFSRVPEIRFYIKKLNANIDSLFAPISIKKGQLLLSEKKDRLLLDFKDFDIRISNAKLLLNCNYNHTKGKAPFLKTTVKANKLNFGKAFYPGVIDSSSSILNTDISGLLNCDIRFSKNKDEKFREIDLNADFLTYWGTKSIIKFQKLRFYATGISYDTELAKNPLATLSGKMEVSAKNMKSKYYQLSDVLYKVNAKNGTYTIKPENDSWFGVKASGKYIISPFTEPPNYSFNYKVEQFPIGKLFASFLEDSVLTGKMDFALRLNFKGDTQDSIIKTMKGKLRVQGSNLILYGVDIDNFFKKFQQTQDFNLLDIGVVVYTGPIGILATKGSGFAKIRVTDRGKYSQIGHMVSDWRIKNDSLIIDDVAFKTEKNRIALKGWYSYSSDSLDFSIGLLDKKGCSILSQSFVGLSENPEMRSGNLFSTVFDPVNNQTKQKGNVQCKPFYKGSLTHPEEKK